MSVLRLCPKVFCRWQKMFFENGTASERREDGRTRKLESRLSALQAKFTSKDEVIAEIMTARVAFEKTSGP